MAAKRAIKWSTKGRRKLLTDKGYVGIVFNTQKEKEKVKRA